MKFCFFELPHIYQQSNIFVDGVTGGTYDDPIENQVYIYSSFLQILHKALWWVAVFMAMCWCARVQQAHLKIGTMVMPERSHLKQTLIRSGMKSQYLRERTEFLHGNKAYKFQPAGSRVSPHWTGGEGCPRAARVTGERGHLRESGLHHRQRHCGQTAEVSWGRVLRVSELMGGNKSISGDDRSD